MPHSGLKIENLFDGSYRPELPPAQKMIEFGLKMMRQSGIGLELVMFAQDNDVEIKITRGAEETSYVSGPKQVVICLKSANPAQPSRFVLLLTGVLRKLMQEYDGLQQPSPTEDMEIILEKMRLKQGDSIAYMCAVAYEINQIETFAAYDILEELKNMGHAKDVDVFLQNL